MYRLTIDPRPYQQEALDWALARGRAVCCLPTGTGKTLIGLLWVKTLHDRGLARRFLVLEPTRLLVNQTAEYYLDKAGAEAVPIDGRIPREQRRQRWSAPLVVATPETAYNGLDLLDVDAVVVDECHHTVGQDAFARLLAARPFSYRLGLSATVPERRRAEVERLVGPVRQWSWTDPEIRPYVPDWIGEVYEGALDVRETEVLRAIRQLPSGPGLGPGMLERYLTRDGTPALLETLRGRGRLAQAYGPQLLPLLHGLDDSLHKWPAVEEILAGHDFQKAIVFVERRRIAHLLGHRLRTYNPVLLMGKGKAGQSQEHALQQARRGDCRVVISTSAGEEGVDLPSADLLVVWGNVASEIRFIQHHGRIMRLAPEERPFAFLQQLAPKQRQDRLKFAVFVVTPETADYDSFLRGLETATERGVVDVEETFGWDPGVLWPRTTWWHVSEHLRGRPRPLAEMEEALHVRDNVARRVIDHAVKRGRLFYVYDVTRIAQDALDLGERWYQEWVEALTDNGAQHDQSPDTLGGGPVSDLEWHRRVGWSVGTSWGGRMRRYRVYALCDDVASVRHTRPDLFSDPSTPLTVELILAGRHGRRVGRYEWLRAGWHPRGSVFLLGQFFSYTPEGDAGPYLAELKSRDDVLGLIFRRRKNERVEYWCKPETPEVLDALASNFTRFLEILDEHSRR